MVEKRPFAPDEAAANDAKKPRINGASGAAASKLDAVAAKARELLEKKAKLQEQLNKLKQSKLQAASASAAAGPRPGTSVFAAGTQKAAQIAASFTGATPGLGLGLPPTSQLAAVGGKAFQPAPLRLDSQGREVDEQGNVIQQPVQPITSLKVNQHLQAASAAAVAQHAQRAALSLQGPERVENDPFFDPAMGQRGVKKLQRRKRDFDWVEEGQFTKQAELARLRAKYGEDAFKKSLGPKKIGPAVDPNKIPIDPNKIPLGKKPEAAPAEEEEEPLPDVEWWDKRILATGKYEDDVDEQEVRVKQQKITDWVEHPVPIEPPAEPAPPPPQPMKLTKRELKKLRTQRRLQREKEKQDLIRQGLLEPPKPKVKVSNIARVLANESVADPTAAEQEARRQMAERQQAHDDRNLARKLTPAEKTEKKIKKLFDENDLEVYCAVYRVNDLSHKLNRTKVRLNAFENHMTGAAVCTESCSVVVVEGCAKSIKRFNKLMLRRMDWNPTVDDNPDDDKPENTCHLVWHGTLKSKLFKDFTLKDCHNPEDAKTALGENSAGHYWDLAFNFDPNEAPPIEI